VFLGLAATFVLAPAAFGDELLLNGNFETGTFFGWTVVDLAGSSGNWFIDTPGTTTPFSGFATSAAGGSPHGNFYAVTDQTGPGTHALLQSFTVTPGSTVFLTFDMFANNQTELPAVMGPQGLNHVGAANQHARVDILLGAAGPFNTGGGVVANLYIGSDPGPNPHPFTSYLFNISPFVAAGGTFQLRFAEVDNQLFFQQGVDNVSINTTVPEPTTLVLLGIGLVGIAVKTKAQGKGCACDWKKWHDLDGARERSCVGARIGKKCVGDKESASEGDPGAELESSGFESGGKTEGLAGT
jgi:hypothetical protein